METSSQVACFKQERLILAESWLCLPNTSRFPDSDETGPADEDEVDGCCENI